MQSIGCGASGNRANTNPRSALTSPEMGPCCPSGQADRPDKRAASTMSPVECRRCLPPRQVVLTAALHAGPQASIPCAPKGGRRRTESGTRHLPGRRAKPLSAYHGSTSSGRCWPPREPPPHWRTDPTAGKPDAPGPHSIGGPIHKAVATPGSDGSTTSPRRWRTHAPIGAVVQPGAHGPNRWHFFAKSPRLRQPRRTFSCFTARSDVLPGDAAVELRSGDTGCRTHVPPEMACRRRCGARWASLKVASPVPPRGIIRTPSC